MKSKVISTLSFLLVTGMGILSIGALDISPRYAIGKVSGFSDNSVPGRLNVTSIVPSPISTTEHQFSALECIDQNCPPGEDCYDIFIRAYSGWSSTGQNLSKVDRSHTTGNRQPQVEGYRYK